MLVLTRKKGEWIDIPLGNDEFLRVGVLLVRGDKVRLGFEAPDEIKIYRREVLIAIEEEERRAAQENTQETGIVGDDADE